MSRCHLALGLCGLLLAGSPAFAQRLHQANIIYSVKFGDDVDVRTLVPPPSAVRAGATGKELQALRDPGLPGYRATMSDLVGAWYVTIYLEKIVTGKDGKVRRTPLAPVYCMVHHNHGNQGYLCLFQAQMMFGNPPPPYLIGDPGGAGIPLPGVHLKRIVVDSYVRLPGAGGNR